MNTDETNGDITSKSKVEGTDPPFAQTTREEWGTLKCDGNGDSNGNCNCGSG